VDPDAGAAHQSSATLSAWAPCQWILPQIPWCTCVVPGHCCHAPSHRPPPIATACQPPHMPWAILSTLVQLRRPLTLWRQAHSTATAATAAPRCWDELLDDRPCAAHHCWPLPAAVEVRVPPRRQAVRSCARRPPALPPLGAGPSPRGGRCATSGPAYRQTVPPHIRVTLPLPLPMPTSAAARHACTCHGSLAPSCRALTPPRRPVLPSRERL
jgi:hypothetical protein